MGYCGSSCGCSWLTAVRMAVYRAVQVSRYLYDRRLYEALADAFMTYWPIPYEALADAFLKYWLIPYEVLAHTCMNYRPMPL
eukprot:1140715-Pelagomonas_calceolata.AAC.10